MSKYAHIIDSVVDNIIVCEDSNISLFSGTYVKVTELTGEAKNGGSYNLEKNKFIDPRPYQSWVLSEEDIWESPDGFSAKEGFWWNETSQEWVALVTTTEG